jgi:uncharacterized protein involved in outer membrane biogenesis
MRSCDGRRILGGTLSLSPVGRLQRLANARWNRAKPEWPAASAPKIVTEATVRAWSGAERQRCQLEAEGVLFDDSGRVDLARFGWRPADPGTGSARP